MKREEVLNQEKMSIFNLDFNENLKKRKRDS